MCQTFSPLSLAFGKHTKNYIKAWKPCDHIHIHLWPRMPIALTSSLAHLHCMVKTADLEAVHSKLHSIFKGQKTLLWQFSSSLYPWILHILSPAPSSPYKQMFDYSLWNVSNIYRNKMLNTNTDWFFLSHQKCLHSKCTQISHFKFKNMNMLWVFFFYSNIMNELKY